VTLTDGDKYLGKYNYFTLDGAVIGNPNVSHFRWLWHLFRQKKGWWAYEGIVIFFDKMWAVILRGLSLLESKWNLLQNLHYTVFRLSTVPLSRNVSNSLLTPRFVQLLSGNSSVNLFAVYPSNTNFYQNRVLVAEYHVDSIWLLTAVTSAVTNFRCHKLIAKVNK